MVFEDKPLRVLHSFPHKIGVDRICSIAWHQVAGVQKAGGKVLLYTGVLSKTLPSDIKVRETLRRYGIRIPYKAVGRLRALALHDWIVSHTLQHLADQIDVIHVWPSAALRTLQVAKKLGICTVLERPNAHTQFAYEIVDEECKRLGVPLPRGHEHEFNPTILKLEEAEYSLADKLLCPSQFVAQTFLDKGFNHSQLLVGQYGCDEKEFFPEERIGKRKNGFSMIFVGGCAPRKGLHFALEAWLESPAKKDGIFTICGAFIPGYAEKLGQMLSHPSVRVLGFRRDIPNLIRENDVFTLPSIEEGSALVTYEARASGCVLLVSDSTGALCTHMENALVHKAGDVKTLTEHIRMLYENREMLARLRQTSLASSHELTWTTAGAKLLSLYRDAFEQKKNKA